MKNIFKKLLIFSVIITLAALFTNCADDESNPTSALGQGNITGKVTDLSSGAGVSDVIITTVPVTQQATTDGDGVYTISNINAGIYTVKANKSGYNENTYEVTVEVEGTATANIKISTERDNRLVGQWDLLEVFVPSLNLTYTAQQLGITALADFLDNGNYEFTTTDDTGAVEVEIGTWKTSNGTLTITYNDGTVEDTNYSIEGNIGILKSTYEIAPGSEIPAEFKFEKR